MNLANVHFHHQGVVLYCEFQDTFLIHKDLGVFELTPGVEEFLQEKKMIPCCRSTCVQLCRAPEWIIHTLVVPRYPGYPGSFMTFHMRDLTKGKPSDVLVVPRLGPLPEGILPDTPIGGYLDCARECPSALMLPIHGKEG